MLINYNIIIIEPYIILLNIDTVINAEYNIIAKYIIIEPLMLNIYIF